MSDDPVLLIHPDWIKNNWDMIKISRDLPDDISSPDQLIDEIENKNLRILGFKIILQDKILPFNTD